MDESSKLESVPEFRIRRMRLEDVDKCLQIWSKVELTEARLTVASSLALDPAAFNVAELKDSSEFIFFRITEGLLNVEQFQVISKSN